MTTPISFRDFLHRFFLKDFFVPSFAKILFTSRLKERSGRRLGLILLYSSLPHLLYEGQTEVTYGGKGEGDAPYVGDKGGVIRPSSRNGTLGARQELLRGLLLKKIDLPKISTLYVLS
jgi:hypothetical protein